MQIGSHPHSSAEQCLSLPSLFLFLHHPLQKKRIQREKGGCLSALLLLSMLLLEHCTAHLEHTPESVESRACSISYTKAPFLDSSVSRSLILFLDLDMLGHHIDIDLLANSLTATRVSSTICCHKSNITRGPQPQKFPSPCTLVF